MSGRKSPYRSSGMRNYVYLFELDSVRKTDAEIIAGQKALYNEIVVNGNIVVMTCNQLVDSRGFFSLLNNPDYQEQLISLFENGAIRISQYGDVRTLAQYLINSVNPEKEFIYSALPVKFSQKRILALIRRSLLYSDLSEIHEYCTGMRTKDELVDLFVEVNAEGEPEQSSLIPKSCTDPANDDAVIQEMKNILENLYGLLKTVLKLSTLHDIYIPPRNSAEYKNLKMHDLLRIAAGFPAMQDPDWDEAIRIICNLPCYLAGKDNRSTYVRNIKEQFGDLPDQEQSRKQTAYRYAEEIVNLCYNYACEISICSVSKHYNFSELTADSAEKSTFQADFMSRFYQEWNNGTDAEERYLAEENDHFREFTQLDALPDLAGAVRFTEYVSYKDDFRDGKRKASADAGVKTDNSAGTNAEAGAVQTENTPVHRYEYHLKNKVRAQKMDVLKSIFGKLFFALICLVLACLIEFAFDFVQNAVDSSLTIPSPVKLLAFLFISEAVTTWISKLFPRFLSLSDALGSMWRLLKDGTHALLGKSDGYCSSSLENVDYCEPQSKRTTVACMLSPELKKYRALVNETEKDRGLFRESEFYPIMDLSRQEEQEQLIRLEEMYQYHFGLVYKSKYNMLLVDPIRQGDHIFPYERICPVSGKDGVVTIPVYKGNFILLNQYRHAPRAVQYGFPRGFAEPGCTPEEDACRELQEEIGAVVTKTPQLVGRVISDSGLTNGRVYVYYVEIDDYVRNASGHEGIRGITEVPCEKMDQWIREGNTDDGFTLSAYALYRCWK